MSAITIYVCPTPGCGNYYGSSNAGDLRKSMNTDMKGVPTFSRALCPDCRGRGNEVVRQPQSMTLARSEA